MTTMLKHAISPELNLSVWPTDEQIGEYLAGTFSGGDWPKIPLNKVVEISQLIREGNDPFLIAVEFHVSFESCARFAENHLNWLFGPNPEKDKDGKPLQRIPHNLRDYLFVAAAFEKQQAAEQAEKRGRFGRILFRFGDQISKFSSAIIDGLKGPDGR
jgi:hypothetical protein